MKRHKRMGTRPGLALLVLAASVGCGKLAPQGDELSATAGTDDMDSGGAGGAGGARAPMSASAGGVALGGTPASMSAGTGGVAPGGAGVGGGAGAPLLFGGCSALACESQFTLRADIPVSLGAARQGKLSVCRNAECYALDLATIADSEWVSLTPMSQTGPSVSVSIERDVAPASLSLAWQLPYLKTGFMNGDSYRVTIENEAATAFINVFDGTIDYRTIGFGCGSDTHVCLQANVDTRGIDSGVAGAGGTSDGGGQAGAE